MIYDPYDKLRAGLRFVKFAGAFALLGLAAGGLHAADQANNPEMRLREQLRNTMLQLRDASSQRDQLQADKTQLTDDNKKLTDQLAALKKQSAADKLSADKTIATLTAKGTDQEADLARLKEDIEKSKTAANQFADVAKAKEEARAKLANDVILLQRKVETDETKNREMFKVANEVLTRYEKFSLGTAIMAREPFVGITRVKLESLVQDYHDKISDQLIRPDNTPTAAGTPAKSPVPKTSKSRS